jgi:Lar family restriction alleviation protein
MTNKASVADQMLSTDGDVVGTTMTDVESVALGPCPFCGGKPIYHAHRIAEDAMVAFVSCSKCGCQTEQFEDAYAPEAEAITAWNTRAALSAMPGWRGENAVSIDVYESAVKGRQDFRNAYRELLPIQRAAQALSDAWRSPTNVEGFLELVNALDIAVTGGGPTTPEMKAMILARATPPTGANR